MRQSPSLCNTTPALRTPCTVPGPRAGRHLASRGVRGAASCRVRRTGVQVHRQPRPHCRPCHGPVGSGLVCAARCPPLIGSSPRLVVVLHLLRHRQRQRLGERHPARRSGHAHLHGADVMPTYRALSYQQAPKSAARNLARPSRSLHGGGGGGGGGVGGGDVREAAPRLPASANETEDEAPPPVTPSAGMPPLSAPLRSPPHSVSTQRHRRQRWR